MLIRHLELLITHNLASGGLDAVNQISRHELARSLNLYAGTIDDVIELRGERRALLV